MVSGTKYVLRTDVIYQRPLPAHPKLSKFASAADAPVSVHTHAEIFAIELIFYFLAEGKEHRMGEAV